MDSSVTLRANTFTREGYTFNGWSTEENGSVVYNDGDTVTLSENTTLYALYKKHCTAQPDAADKSLHMGTVREIL